MHKTRTRPIHFILHNTFQFVVNNKILTAGLILSVLAIFGFQLTKLTFDNTPDGFFMQGDPNLTQYEDFKEQFQSDEFSLILLKAPDVWGEKFISAIENAVLEIESIEHVSRVVSITNVNHIEAQGDEIVIDSLFNKKLEPADYRMLRSKILAHPRYTGLFVSHDGAYAAIVVETEIIKNEVGYKIVLTERLRSVIKDAAIAVYEPRIVGAPILDADVRVIVSWESSMLTAMCFGLILVGFWIVFRSAYAMLIASTILITSLVVTFGIMATLGFPYTVLTPIVPTFLMSVGINGLIFLLTSYCYTRDDTISPQEALKKTYVEVGGISLLTMLTTSAALFAFSTSDVKPVLQVGIIMGSGLIIMYIATMLWVPIFLGSNAQEKLKLGGAVLSQRVELLVRLGEWVIKNHTAIFVGFLVVCLVSLVGLFQLKTDYHYLGMFKASTKIYQDYSFVDEKLPTSASIEIVISSDVENAMRQPSVLKAMDQFSRYLEEHSPLPVKIYSLADVVKELNQAFNDNDEAHYLIPDSEALIAQELVLFEFSDQKEVQQLVDFQYRKARITIRVPNVSDSKYRPLIELIEDAKVRYFSDAMALDVMSHQANSETDNTSSTTGELRVVSTGLVDLWVALNDYLTESQITSVLLAFLAVTIAMVGIFKSLVMGVLLGLINLSVVVMVLGVMGALNIPLDPYSVLIASIALGILDDDTMHFVKSVEEDMNANISMEDAIRNTYSKAGQAMFYTTAILVCSFSINIFSDIASLTKFGVLISLTLLLGLLIEFLVTPTLILLFGSRLLKQTSDFNEEVPVT